MKVSFLHSFVVLFLCLIFYQAQVRAQEIHTNILRESLLYVDYDSALGRVEVVQRGGNIVVTAYLEPGADFNGWVIAGLEKPCLNSEKQCVFPASLLKETASPLRIKATFSSGTAYLLLHGMNSNPGVWHNFIVKHFGSCGVVEKGQAVVVQSLGDDQRCFALQAGVVNGWRNGDGMTYQQLGREITDVLGDIQAVYPGIGKFILIGHSRGGLAAKAAFAANTSSMQKVHGLMTVGTPHLGSAFGRIQEWLNANPRPTRKSCIGVNALGESEETYCTMPGANGMASEYDRDRAWRLADFMESPIGNTPLDSPTISYLSVDSSMLVALNQRDLPSDRKYATVSSDGLNLGKIYHINIFGEGLGVFAPPLPVSAQHYLIHGKNNQGKTYLDYRGDGIVALDSQKSLPVSGFIENRTLSGVFHDDMIKSNLGTNAIIDLLPEL